jgi:pyruvate formate lyase activating enzyme
MGMLISAIQKFTMLDYPDHTACIVFTPGCNFRCGYCHNPEFVLPEMIAEIRDSFIPEDVFFRFLEKRIGKLDGVVITGGEPTLMPDLERFIHQVQSMGFLVKLDSNGGRPEVLTKLFEKNMLDYVAMDVKTSLEKYPSLVGPRIDPQNIQKSIALIMKSGVDYEFRTTVVKELHTNEVLEQMSDMMNGSKQFFLQNFRPQKTLNPKFETYHSFSPSEMENMKHIFCKNIENVYVR